MPRARRKELIAEIEELRGSRVLCYVTGDRSPTPAQIGDDAVRPMYERLREIGHVGQLDVYIYSRGGAIDVPWRMVNAVRTASDTWNVLIPFRANSAATLFALGADGLVLGRNGELGPIDPRMSVKRDNRQDDIAVEDVMAYVRFVQERAGLSDQSALATSLGKLADRLDAVALGSLYRTHSHIRDVARRILLTRRNPGVEQTVTIIVETLAEKVYAHGHAIGLSTAQEIGLPATAAPAELDDLMWELLKEYETDLKLLEPIDPAHVVASQDKYEEQATLAVVETTAGAHEFQGRIEVQAKRQMPQNVNVALNLNLQLPQGAQGAPPANVLQQLLQNAQQAVLQQAQQAVQDALKAQAPVAGVEGAFRNGRWVALP